MPSKYIIKCQFFYKVKSVYPLSKRIDRSIWSKLPYIFSDGIIRNATIFYRIVFDNPI
jgi:hypothetical protein